MSPVKWSLMYANDECGLNAVDSRKMFVDSHVIVREDIHDAVEKQTKVIDWVDHDAIEDDDYISVESLDRI